MTNSYDVDHGLSQCHPGPLEPVEIAKQDDTLARTGNTARDQEMYAAGIEVGEANTKHNAAIRASMPDGWELVTRKTCYALMHDGAVIATLAGPESETNAAIIARMLAAPGVSTVEDAQNEQPKRNGCGSVSFKLSDGSAVSCDWSTHEWELSIPATRHERDIAFKELLQEIGRLRASVAAPAAGDALDLTLAQKYEDACILANANAQDAARWRFVRRKLCLIGNGDGTCAMHALNLPASIHGWPEPGSAVAEFCDAAIDAAIAAQQGEGGAA